MKKVRKFQANDKVFAKVRGYPPWPAKVVGVADESSRMKYHIYFYGTGETAIVKGEDVFSYVENRNGKLGKPRKLKGFNEALAQTDNELSPEEKEQVDSSPADSADVSVLSEDGGTPGRRLSVASNKDAKQSTSAGTPSEPEKEAPAVVEEAAAVAETKAPKARKRKSEMPEPPSEAKKSKVDTSSPAKPDVSATEDSPTKSQPHADITSRSGRKIKPKKFSDFDEVLEEDSMTALKNKSAKSSKPKEADLSTENELIFVHDNETFKIPLNLNRPTFKNHKSSADWKSLVTSHAETLKGKITAGDFTSEQAVKAMEEFTKEKASEKKKEYEEDDHTFAVLHVEGRLLQLDLKIRSSLGLNKADADECLKCMDEFSSLPITALMLKKNPEVVETFKRLRRYVGNTSIWVMKEEEAKEFNTKAQSIRNKADHIFNKMKGLFTVPEGKSFWSVFTTQLVDFNKVTRKLSQADFYAITKDPVE